MCFSSTKMPDIVQAPQPVPIPAKAPATQQTSVVPTPSTSKQTDVSPVTPSAPGISSVSSQTADQRRRRIASMRFGLRSTIRTSGQGVAGSGKTSIALHRIAFLLYRFKERIKSEEMVQTECTKPYN